MGTAGIILGGASLATGVLGSIFGGAKQRRAARRARRQLNNMKRDEAAWYNREYYTDEMDRSETKRLLNRVENTLTKQTNNARGAAAVSGATQGAVLGAQANAQQTLADAAGNISSQSSARKSRLSAQHQQNLSNLSAGQMNINMAQQEGGANMIANGAKLAGQGLTALADVYKWQAKQSEQTSTQTPST